jgi:hypothetical protein
MNKKECVCCLPELFSGWQRHGELWQPSEVLDADSHLFRTICANVKCEKKKGKNQISSLTHSVRSNRVEREERDRVTSAGKKSIFKQDKKPLHPIRLLDMYWQWPKLCVCCVCVCWG